VRTHLRATSRRKSNSAQPWRKLRSVQKSMSRKTTTDLVRDVYIKAGNYKFGLELMVAGIDDSDAHLYRVTFSNVNSHEGMAFTAIGCGQTVASVLLAQHGHTTLVRPLAETIYRVYEAKRVSEQTRLVGEATDILILRKGQGHRFLSAEALGTLERIYQQRRPPAMSPDDLSAIAEICLEGTPPPPEEREPSTPDQPDQPGPP
jgi:20S proteasome alpha/beta subunit